MNFKKLIEDQVGTGDMAGMFSNMSAATGPKRRLKKRIKPKKHFREKACFEMDNSDEYNSFCQGEKKHHRWGKHTKSSEIRQWANENRGKEFYVTHNNSYTLIKRKG